MKFPAISMTTTAFPDRAMGFLTVLIVCLTTGDLWGEESARPKLGDEIGNLRFKDIRYVPRSLRDFGEKRAFVVIFTNTTCPLVQKYWPKLKRLEEQYHGQGVQFVSVNVGPDDEIQEIAQQAIDFGIEFPLVKDTDGSCVKSLGVEWTPEVAVLDGQRRLRYRGRIDDQLRISGTRPEVLHDDLKDALDDLLAGREPAIGETVVDGCRITPAVQRSPETPVTFHEHIAPLFQKHCQDCQHAGGLAPFSSRRTGSNRVPQLARSSLSCSILAGRRWL
jgi:thiol-disulfide isomerase/thioredoxin